jgi:competence ComEA-like helix-hairpin-helix protein
MSNLLRSILALSFVLVPGVAYADARPADLDGAASATQSMTAFAESSKKLEGKINVNTASAEQWELLPGIGPSTAAKLVDYRNKQKFGDVTHVMRVKGVGRKTFAQIKDYLALEGETTLKLVSGE